MTLFRDILRFCRSSTLLKKVPIPKRHLDSFGGYEYSLGSKRGVILHTDRYQVSGLFYYPPTMEWERI